MRKLITFLSFAVAIFAGLTVWNDPTVGPMVQAMVPESVANMPVIASVTGGGTPTADGTYGGIGAAMSAIGAVPTSMTATEVRQAMDSGVVQAVSFAPHAHMSFGTIENAEWWTTNLNPGTVNCPVVVNTDALNDLSPAHREALLGSVDEALDHYVANYNGATMDAWGPELEKRGIAKVTFTDAEIAAFKEAAAAPAAKEWIEQNTAAGLPAQELYDLVTGMIAKAN